MTAVRGSCPPGKCMCGACLGLTASTPVQTFNRPGLSAITYRVGTHPLFKRSLLAALSSSSHPALQGLGTRDDDDYTIALLDGWATLADVLSFYQERIANESYLLTATERRSLLELGRLIGYELRPGVAASTFLAFTLESGSGSPRRTTIDPGVKVQSIPGPNEKPQTFETVSAVDARVEWNALTPRTTSPQALGPSTRRLYLKGTDTQLQVGDAILEVGEEREASASSSQWAFRFISSVTTDAETDTTLVTWPEALDATNPGAVHPVGVSPRVYALRQRAALFGHNAPDPLILHLDGAQKEALLDEDGEWKGFAVDGASLDLDIVYPKLVSGGWVVFLSQSGQALARASAVSTLSASRFAVSGKFTQIVPDPELDVGDTFGRRDTSVFGQSDELDLAEVPVREPVYGNEVALGQLAADLEPGQVLAFTGRRQRLKLTQKALGLTLTAADGTTTPILPGDSLQMVSPPVVAVGGETAPVSAPDLVAALDAASNTVVTWELQDQNGFVGTLSCACDRVVLEAAHHDDPDVSQIATIDVGADAVITADSYTSIRLKDDLLSCFDRSSVRINANVASATHGETVQEVLGSGNAAQSYQQFTLKQAPLTYVSAATASGAKSTLDVRVNDLLWQEVPTLYGRGPRERVYVTHHSDDAKTIVEFGDGNTGARLSSGRENVRARYRKGIGLEGLMKAGQLSQLMTRPLGVKEAINPEPASGAADPESPTDARRNAPLTVMTLDRAVSLRDYEDFARAFGGVAKALATWTWDGGQRRIFITVAGPSGAEIKPDSATFANLIAAITSSGDPFVRFAVRSFRPATFALVAKVKVDEPTYLRADVLIAVEAALRERFSFDAREFAQPVTLSEVIGAIQEVPGVVAADVDKLYRTDAGAATLETRLPAAGPSLDSSGNLLAAELLRLDPAPLEFGVML